MIPLQLFPTLFLCTVISISARAETPCETAIESRAVITLGAVQCAANWLDDPAVTLLEDASSGCYKTIGKAKVRRATAQGGADWDRYVAELGHAGACEKLAASVKQMSGLLR